MIQVVRTLNSAYLLDHTAKTCTRYPSAVSGSPLRKDDEPVGLVRVLHLKVGDPAVLLLRGLADDVLTHRTTSPVVAIEEPN